jgi:hypothetical protein
MLRCCKTPLDNDGPLFEVDHRAGFARADRPLSRAPFAEPTVFHHGNRGMTRDRILAEHTLFEATRVEIALPPMSTGPIPYRGSTPRQIHGEAARRCSPLRLARSAGAGADPVLAENIGDWVRLITFIVAIGVRAVAAGADPGLAMPWQRYLILLALVVSSAIAMLLKKIGVALPGTAVATSSASSNSSSAS